jgi:hypothetical protein
MGKKKKNLNLKLKKIQELEPETEETTEDTEVIEEEPVEEEKLEADLNDEEEKEEVKTEGTKCFGCGQPIGLNEEGEVNPHFIAGVITPGPIHYPGCALRYLLRVSQQLGENLQKMDQRLQNVEQITLRLLK